MPPGALKKRKRGADDDDGGGRVVLQPSTLGRAQLGPVLGASWAQAKEHSG